MSRIFNNADLLSQEDIDIRLGDGPGCTGQGQMKVRTRLRLEGNRKEDKAAFREMYIAVGCQRRRDGGEEDGEGRCYGGAKAPRLA